MILKEFKGSRLVYYVRPVMLEKLNKKSFIREVILEKFYLNSYIRKVI
jgi:hypothetical protein